MSESSILNLSRLLSNAPERTGSTPRGPRISPEQQEILRIVRSAPASVRPHLAAWWFSAEVDTDRLDGALRALLESNAILRTVYRIDRSAPRAALRPTPEHLLEVTDLADGLDPANAVTAEEALPIDPTAQLPIRVRAHRRADGTLLTVAVHPVAADERSFARIIDAIGTAYSGTPDPGSPAPSPAVPAAVDTGAEVEDHGSADFWVSELAEAPSESIADRAPRRAAGPTVDRSVAPLTSAIPVDIEQDVRVAALVAGAVFDEWGLEEQVIALVDPAETDLVGPLDHLVPLRIRIDDAQSPAALIDTIAATAARVRPHRAGARRALRNPTRRDSAPGTATLLVPVHVVVSVHSDRDPALTLDGRAREPITYRTAPAPGADVSVVVRPHGAQRRVEVTVNGRLAGRHDAHGFAHRLVDLARIWAAGPRRALSRIPRAGQSHPTLLGAPLDRTEPLGFPFGGAPLRPDRSALRTARGEVTFGQLAEQAERLADDLASAAVAPGDVVAVAADDPVVRLVALIALIRVGAGCALLERDTLRAGSAGIDAAVAASRAVAVVRVESDGATRVDSDGAIRAGSDGAVRADASATDPAAAGQSPHAPTALVFLTPSRTRVVSLDRRQLEDRVRALMPETPVASRVAAESSADARAAGHALDTVLIVPEIGSADSCAMALAVLVAEGTVVLPEPADRADPARLVDLATRSGAGHVVVAPTTIADMMVVGGLSADLVRLTLVGEPVRPALSAALRTALPRTRIATVYGVADAGGAGLIGVLADPARLAPTPAGAGYHPVAGILGTPVPGMGVCILDRRGRAVPTGVVGEIHLLREGATVPTGDRGMWSASGAVVGLGRAISATVAGGPVGVEDLEDLLGSIDGVLAPAVTVESIDGGVRLRALLVVEPGSDVARVIGRAREVLADATPGRSIEYTIDSVAFLPTTGAGVLDRVALASADTQSMRAAAGSGGAAATPTEELVAEAFAAALDPPLDEPVGRTDGFFAIGGDSLAALRLVARLNGTGYPNVDVAAIFEYSTVGELAEYLDRSATTPSTEAAEPVEPVAPMAASGLDEATLAALRLSQG